MSYRPISKTEWLEQPDQDPDYLTKLEEERGELDKRRHFWQTESYVYCEDRINLHEAFISANGSHGASEAGGELALKVEQVQKELEYLKYRKDDELRSAFLKMLEGIHIFKDRADIPFAKSEVFFMLRNCPYQEELEGELEGYPSRINLDQLSVKIKDGSISTKLLYALTQSHKRNLEKQNLQLQRQVEETRSVLSNALDRTIEEQKLPAVAKAALAKIESSRVIVGDTLKNFLEAHAPCSDRDRAFMESTYYPNAHTIVVDNNSLQEDRERILRRNLIYEFQRAMSLKVKRDRVFDLLEGCLAEGENLIASWINRGVTAYLGRELSGLDHPAYVEELEDVEGLLERGLSKQKLLDNYYGHQPNENLAVNRGEIDRLYCRAIIKKMKVYFSIFSYEILEIIRQDAEIPLSKENTDVVETWTFTLTVGEETEDLILETPLPLTGEALEMIENSFNFLIALCGQESTGLIQYTSQEAGHEPGYRPKVSLSRVMIMRAPTYPPEGELSMIVRSLLPITKNPEEASAYRPRGGYLRRLVDLARLLVYKPLISVVKQLEKKKVVAKLTSLKRKVSPAG